MRLLQSMMTLSLRIFIDQWVMILGFILYASNLMAHEKPANALIDKCMTVGSTDRTIINNFRDWEVVALKDLLPEDRRTWMKYYGNISPGYVCGNFDRNPDIDLAIIIFTTKSRVSTNSLPSVPPNIDVGSKRYDPSLRIKLLLFPGGLTKQKPIELLSSPTPYLPVLRSDGPGIYTDAYDEHRSFRAKHDVLLLEQLESGVLGIYLDGKAVKMATLSD